ncbi:MAG: bifunctional glutamate N-acetyltransferase/amino-acid acetyltransferase ArgJ [Rickettsiales bacterium]|nr:bifunctional glutamate N-acetyltransferase/amino-acid acetyltransferase ArgJ [Rickettsiales bacterium]
MALPVSPLAPAHFPDLAPLAGVTMAAAEVGIRYKNRLDVWLALLPAGTQCAGVLTRSLTASAPVEWCRQALRGGTARALIVNSGNSNAFTGHRGEASVKATIEAVAAIAGCHPHEVFIASTGVIGEPLAHEKILTVLPQLFAQATEDNWLHAARAIMTTDTFPKLAMRKAFIGDTEVTVQGIGKGSGMIAPDMATMLAFLFTDAAIDAPILQTLLSEATQRSFNSITVDSDTSTSDTCLLFATAKAKHPLVQNSDDPLLDDFRRALQEVMLELALMIVRDGEGATKLVEIIVQGAENEAAARQIGLSIANSPLVKTAVAGEDPNWGRIVAAIGKSGAQANRDRLRILIGNVLVAEQGMVHPAYQEAEAAAHMKRQEIQFTVDVGVGSAQATVYTCDLTEQYIKINADYRS